MKMRYFFKLPCRSHALGLGASHVCHHPTTFDVNRHCGSGDIMVLVYHVILQDHVIKVLSDLMGGSS